MIKLKVNFNASFETNYYHLKRTYPRIITAHKNCILTNINLFKILAYHFKLSYSEVSYIISTAVYSAKNINIVCSFFIISTYISDYFLQFKLLKWIYIGTLIVLITNLYKHGDDKKVAKDLFKLATI